MQRGWINICDGKYYGLHSTQWGMYAHNSNLNRVEVVILTAAEFEAREAVIRKIRAYYDDPDLYPVWMKAEMKALDALEGEG